jgi:hypothetical protein
VSTTPETTQQPKSKFVVKNGKLIRLDVEEIVNSDKNIHETTSGHNKKSDKKPAFSIVDGKLVRSDKIPQDSTAKEKKVKKEKVQKKEKTKSSKK